MRYKLTGPPQHAAGNVHLLVQYSSPATSLHWSTATIAPQAVHSATMTHSHLLCGLPLIFTERFAVGSKLVSEWLSVEAVARLDSALCCTGRSAFLRLLSSNGIHLPYYNHHGVANVVTWLLRRQASVLSLDVAGNIPISVLEAYLRQQGGHLRHLYLHERIGLPDQNRILLLIAQHCQSLDVLRLHSRRLPPAYLVAVLSSCRKLTTFYAQCIHIDSLVVLTTMCGCLTSLETTDITFDEEHKERLQTIANLGGLHKLILSSVDCSSCTLAMRAIATSCHNLKEVELNLLSMDSLLEVVRNCPAMQSFVAKVSSAVSPDLFIAIAHNWQDLRRLVLRRKMVQFEWTDQHEAAVVNLIQQVPCLQVLVCVNGNKPSFVRAFDVAKGAVSLAPFTSTVAALRELWVTRLSAGALKTLLAHCPDLCKISHVAPAEPAFLTALAASEVTDVSFSCAGTAPDQLDAFQDLTSLRLWDVGAGYECALSEVAARSRELKTLYLRFRQRPSLRLFPDLLRHVPDLGVLSVKAGTLNTESDDDSDGEGGDGTDGVFVQNVVDAMESLVEVLCPSVGWTEIVL